MEGPLVFGGHAAISSFLSAFEVGQLGAGELGNELPGENFLFSLLGPPFGLVDNARRGANSRGTDRAFSIPNCRDLRILVVIFADRVTRQKMDNTALGSQAESGLGRQMAPPGW